MFLILKDDNLRVFWVFKVDGIVFLNVLGLENFKGIWLSKFFFSF